MRKTSQIALSVLLCVTVAFTSGCSIGKKKTTEKADSEYVTLGEYKKISLKKSEVTEQVQKQIDSTLDSYAEYKKKNTVDADAKIPTAIKVLVIVLIVAVGGLGAIAGCVAGVALSKSPSEDYRHFGKTMMTVSIVMLVLSFICCVLGTAAGAFSNIMYETF